MLFGELHSDTLEHLSVVTLEGTEEHTITVHNDKSEFLIIFEEHLEWVGDETSLTTVDELVPGLKWREIVGDLLLLLAIVDEDDTAENNKTVVGNTLVKLQLYNKWKIISHTT